MNLLYLDCFSGISGDMLLGALVDAGLDPGALEAELRKLKLKDWSLKTEKVRRGALVATKLDFTSSESHHHRTWKAVRELIESSALSDAVKRRALSIFERLARAEAQVHGTPLDDVHFHEVGALDSILDIVGAAVAFERMGIERVVCSPLKVGSGTVETAHGTLPVPAPATALLLSNVPIMSGPVEAELVTPTGAAVVASEAQSFGPVPAMMVTAIGYGAGSRDFKEQPNVLRVFVGASQEAASPGLERVTVLETNVDDMSPVVTAHFIEQALAAGALDVYCTPVQMKKNRPGVLLSVLCKDSGVQTLTNLIFAQTTTLGLRIFEVERRVLEREFETVQTPHGPVRFKVARLNGHVLKAAPEYEDCRALANSTGISLQQVMADAEFSYRQAREGSK